MRYLYTKKELKKLETHIEEELDFKLENDMDALLDKIGDENINPVVQIDRKNYCSEN